MAVEMKQQQQQQLQQQYKGQQKNLNEKKKYYKRLNPDPFICFRPFLWQLN